MLAYGAATLISQVLILRELLVLAQGRELMLALALWSWLLWTGLGSLWGGRLISRFPPTPGTLGAALAGLGALSPVTILAARALPSLLNLGQGQLLSPGAALILFLILLAPFGILSGLFFPWACQAAGGRDEVGGGGQGPTAPATLPQTPSPNPLSYYEAGEVGGRRPTPSPAPIKGWVGGLGGGKGAALPGPPPNSNPIGRVYFLEALGAAAGVGLVQLFLIGRVPNLVIALGLGLILAAGAAKTRFSLIRGSLVKLLILVLAIGLALAFRLDRESRGWQWPGRLVLAAVDSPYALLTATREAEQFSFFINNLWYFTYPDPYTAEHQVQLALLEHPDPQQVLLLGGGAAGLIPEILKTGAVRRVDYVELDPQLVRLTETLLPAGALAPDARTRIIYQDARTFLNKGAESYDVIILALPEPRNAQLNRFYSLEFFRLVRKRLTPSGVFSFGLTGAPASLSPLRAGYLGAAYNTLKSAFPEVLAFPGEQVRFFASPTEAALTGDPGVLLARLKERGLALKYIRDYYLTYDLSYSRQRYLREVLNGQPPVVNTDLSPRGYFYDLTLASAQEGVPLKEILLFLSGTPSWILWAGLGLWTVLLKLLSRGHSRPLLLYQVVVMGLGTMALEILILILYQIHLGALYQHLGVLMAAFMAGLAAGAILAPRLPQRAGAGWLAFFQGGAALLALGLALILPKLTGPFPPVWEGVLQTGLAAALALAGLAGGAIFSLAAAALEQARPSSPGKRAGWLYAVDLLGATLGILGVSFLILPVWGIIPSLYLLAALHAGAAVMVIGEKG